MRRASDHKSIGSFLMQKPYSKEERAEALQNYLKRRTVENRNRVVELNIPLVMMIMRMQHERFGSPTNVSVEELISDVFPNVIRAVELYDPSYKVQFSTYLAKSLVNSSVRSYYVLSNSTRASVRKGLLRAIPFSEIDTEDSLFSESLPDKEITDLSDIPKDWFGRLHRFLVGNDLKIILLRFRDGLTLEEAGEVLQLTRERVRQIQKRAIRRLKSIEVQELLGSEQKVRGVRLSELEQIIQETEAYWESVKE